LIETTNRLESPLRSIQLEHQTKNFFVESGVLIPNDPEKLIRESEYFNILSQRRQYYNYFLLMKENSLKELEIVQDLIEQELSM
jgi:hypothetical protein